MNETLSMCTVCGFPGSCARLIRLSWMDGPQMTGEFFQMSIVLVTDPQPNDVLICEECIRGIKRLPLTEVTSNGPHVFSNGQAN